MRTQRLGRAAASLALAALLLLLAPASPALAHASLISTDPVDGAQLETAPSTVTLTFNEAVQPVEGAVQLIDADGNHYEAEALAHDLDVMVHLDADLGEGHYFLNWRVISADAHPIAGMQAFTIGSPPPAEAPAVPVEEQDTDRWPVMAAGTLHYLGLLLFAGFLFFRAAIAREHWPPRPRHRLLRASGAVAVLGAALAVPIGALDQAGLGLTRIVDVGAWRGLVQSEPLMILGLTVVGVGAAYACFTRMRGDAAVPAALGAAALATAAPVLSGHSLLFGPDWLMAAADVAHLYTGAIWLGGLAGLILLLRFAREGGPIGALGAATVVARFSSWAGLTVLVLGTTGVAMALLIHRTWDGFLGSDHGRMLIVKLALVAVALLLAMWNRFRLVPVIGDPERARPGLSRLRRVLLGEVSVVALVVVVTGTLVNLSPGESEPEAPQETSVQAVIGDGAASLELDPGAAGENAFTLSLTDAAGAPLEPWDPPVVMASLPEQDFGPVHVEALPQTPGVYTGALDLPLPGLWELEIHVRTGEYEHHIATGEIDLH